MKKFNKIFVTILSYIGAIGFGCFLTCGIEYVFDKWTGLGMVVSACLMSVAFIGGKESIPEDEQEGE